MNPRIPPSIVADQDALPEALRSLRQQIGRRGSSTVPIGRRYRLAEDAAGRLVVQYRPPLPDTVSPTTTVSTEADVEPRTVAVLYDPSAYTGG